MDEILLISAYNEIIKKQPLSRMGYVDMHNLYSEIRNKKGITLQLFKEWMVEFFNKYNLNGFEFARATIARTEVKRYSFIIDNNVYYYMVKRMHRC
ncbi:hypothetical protein GQ473_00305 [archaeon]|nr:hypothetical protein [archaeon]